MKIYIALAALAISATSFAEDMILISHNPQTREIAITAFPWRAWRARNKGKNDEQIWRIESPKAIAALEIKDWNHVPIKASEGARVLPADEKARGRWRWNPTTKRVFVDASAPKDKSEIMTELQATLKSDTATQEEKMSALLKLERIKLGVAP